MAGIFWFLNLWETKHGNLGCITHTETDKTVCVCVWCVVCALTNFWNFTNLSIVM